MSLGVEDEKVEVIKKLLKPPPQIQKYEPHHRKNKNKRSGYERWLDRWPFLK